MLTKKELEEIKEREKWTSGGLWTSQLEEGQVYAKINDYVGPLIADCTPYARNDKANAQFIAHSRQDVPKLVETLERAVELLKYLRFHYDTCDLKQGFKNCDCGSEQAQEFLKQWEGE